MKIKESFSLRVADDLMFKCHRLRLEINRNHESGKKGSFEKESVLLDEYFDSVSDLVNYLVEEVH